MEAISSLVDRLDVFINEIVCIDDKEKSLFFHKYPTLSRFWCVLLVSFVFFFEPKYLLSYILFFLIVLFGVRKPVVANVLKPYLKYYFWDNPNPFMRQNLKVKVLDAVKLVKAMQDI